MKRILQIIFSMIITLTLFGCVTVFASGSPVVTVNSVICDKGGIVEVPIVISGNTGFSNLGLEIGYDSSVLTLESVVNNSEVGATYTPSQNIDANPYTMVWDSITNTTFNGALATLKFKVSETAEEDVYPVTVSYYKGRNGNYTDGFDVNYDENFDPLMLSYVNGNITVENEIPSSTDYPYTISNEGFMGETLIADIEYSGSSGNSSAKLIIATYNSAGEITDLDIKDINGDIMLSELDYSLLNGETIKLFIWDDFDNVKPLSKVVEIKK